jgi:hypothetical protein
MDIASTLGEKLRQRRAWVPPVAVVAVAIAAIAATWFAGRPDDVGIEHAGRPARPIEQPVVKAPPLTTPNTAVAGGPPNASSCASCGVVEAIAMLENQRAFLMQIRMSDGSLRTVQQSVPLMAGSRVVVEGRVARPLPAQAPQG